MLKKPFCYTFTYVRKSPIFAERKNEGSVFTIGHPIVMGPANTCNGAPGMLHRLGTGNGGNV